DPHEMEAALRRAVAQNPDIQAVITADNAVPYGDFVSLIDAVRLSGIKKYALTVTEKPEEKGRGAWRSSAPSPACAFTAASRGRCIGWRSGPRFPQRCRRSRCRSR